MFTETLFTRPRRAGALALALLLGLLSVPFEVRSADTPERRLPRLYLIGDSTLKTPTKGQKGWGDPFVSLFDPAKIEVRNMARGGRSSRTYLTEGLWDRVAADLKPGDFLLIQFGHNDGGPLNSGRARASLKGVGDETQEVDMPGKAEKEVVHTYGWYVTKFASEAKAKGATVVVFSPVPRNIWDKDGKVVRARNDYGRWASEAASKAGAIFIDLNDLVAKTYEQVGRETVGKTYFGTDHTHTTEAGAAVTAGVVAEALKGLKDSPFTRYMVDPAPADTKGVTGPGGN